MLTFKLHDNEDIRRFQLDKDTSFAGMVAHLRKFFIQEEKDFSLSWQDEEEDHVALKNETDWAECLRLNANNAAAIHLFVKRPVAIPISREEESSSTPTPAPTPGATSTPAPGAAGFPFQQFLGQAMQNGGMEQLLGLARTPQGQQLLSQLGVSPQVAESFLGKVAGGAGKTDNDNNAAEKGVAICDECDLPIEGGFVRFHCLSCPDFDVHEHCKKVIKHDPEHLFETNYASAAHIKSLTELGTVSRDLAIEILNHNKGNFNASLEQVLAE